MKQKIVIIEDDEAIRQLYTLKLNLKGYDIATAANGLEGLKIIKEFMPILILLDLRMPFMNGEQMLAELRKNAWAADIKVMILTNISKSEAPASLRLLGVDRYIVKAHHTPNQIAEEVCHLLEA